MIKKKPFQMNLIGLLTHPVRVGFESPFEPDEGRQVVSQRGNKGCQRLVTWRA
jgi:ribosomal protein L34